MLAERRHQLILRELRANGPVSAAALAGALGVSAATIRRDLVQLDAQGLLTRVYGGAAPVAGHDDPFGEVAAQRVTQKDAIAIRAAELIGDGQTVLLDIGTTAHRLARQLRGRSLTVITSNIVAFEELADDPGIQLLLLGGMLRREYRSVVGFLTEDNLRQVHADLLFLGTSGVRPDGRVMDTTVIEVPVKRAMIAASDQVILLADSGKFPGRGMASVCGAGELDVLVTDAPAEPRTAARLREADVTVIEAPLAQRGLVPPGAT
jgi:DeoR/GlpR family transcriptional regulator of sugar metabolism